MSKLPIGKLENSLLEKLVFARLGEKNPLVLEAPGIGKDCAVLDFGENLCVLSSDPITGAASSIGSLAIDVSANDIATQGIRPLGIILTCLFPEGTTEDDVRQVMEDASAAAKRAKVSIIGGHTEVTKAVAAPVIVSTAIGKKSAGARKPDADIADGRHSIFVTKPIALEGTAIIAADCEDRLRDVLTEEEIAEARGLVSRLSVIEDGVLAGGWGAACMHDITEGGVLGAVWEICRANDVGAIIDEGSIPILDVTRKICDSFAIDPLKLISSGSMLVVARGDMPFTKIGEITKAKTMLLRKPNGEETAIEEPKADELYKVINATT